MNYHSEGWICDKVIEHYEESLKHFASDRIVGIFCQGSQNYGLDTPTSDIDTKLVVVPTLRDIVMAEKPISTTYIRENEEHIDFKDVRLMLQTFRKQNVNFIEILFTPYYILNTLYQDEWAKLIKNRERIARYCPYAAVKTMKGVAMEKYYAMEHRYPAKIAIIDKYGYDPKQVSHLVRIHDFISAYIDSKSYQDCLHPIHENFILDIKLGKYSLAEARKIATGHLEDIIKIADNFCEKTGKNFDTSVEDLLNEVQYEIMKIAIQKELM